MENKVCYIFGHSDAPDGILKKIKETAEVHYHAYGVRTFIVGGRGCFDHYAVAAIKDLKDKYSDISLLLELLDNPMQETSILELNDNLLQKADTFICYVRHPHAIRTLLQDIKNKEGKMISNLAR